MAQYPSHKVKEFKLDSVICENKDGEEVKILCDHIILAMGARSNEFDVSSLEDAGIEVYSVGDAAQKHLIFQMRFVQDTIQLVRYNCKLV